MTLLLLEGAVNTLHTYLAANMAAKVINLNTRYSDTMEDIKTWYKGNMPISSPEFPSVAIAGSGVVPRVQRALSLHMAAEISLVVFVGHDDIEVRFNRLCRYALGLIELCHTGEHAMGYHVNFLGRITVTDTLETTPFVQGIIIPVTMEQIEDF
jgi:hypothetical protein